MVTEKITQIINIMNKNDYRCQGAVQQMSNGFYRIFDTLEVISGELNSKKNMSSNVSSIRSTLNKNEIYCQGASQQCANGSYRIVEILCVIISQLDEKGKYISKTNEITNLLNKNNIYCQGAPQQVANGCYRIVELLEILAEILAPAKSSAVSSSIATMNKNNIYCQGAPQQSANGTDAAFVILQYIVSELDTKNKYSSNLSNIASLKSRNNVRCQGADQQSANNLYRIMETLNILACIFDDIYQERIKAYWEEHSDEYQQLINEKNDAIAKIREIEANANAINANDELEPLEKEKSSLTKKKDNCGAEELKTLQAIITKLKEERSQIGFFKFALKKEATAKIDEAKANYQAKEHEINMQKADIQKEIDKIVAKINKIKSKLEQDKKALLATCEPYKRTIRSVDNQLTQLR